MALAQKPALDLVRVNQLYFGANSVYGLVPAQPGPPAADSVRMTILRAAFCEMFASWQRFVVKYTISWAKQLIHAQPLAERRGHWEAIASQLQLKLDTVAPDGAPLLRAVVPTLPQLKAKIREHLQDFSFNSPCYKNIHEFLSKKFGVNISAVWPVPDRAEMKRFIGIRGNIVHGEPVFGHATLEQDLQDFHTLCVNLQAAFP